MLPSGFKYMPVSKGLMIVTIACPLLVSVLDLKHWFILSYSPFISEWGQFYRLFYYQLGFMSLSDVIVSVALITVSIKNLERWYGSIKFLHIIICIYLYNMIFTSILIFFSYNLLGINWFVPSGPLGLIFGLLLHAWEATPITYQFKLSNVYLTDKSATLLFALQLFASQLAYNIMPVLIGLIIGLLTLRDILPAKNVRSTIIVRTFEYLRNRAASRDNPALSLHIPPGGTTDGDSNIDNLDAVDLNDNENQNNAQDNDTPVRPLATQFFDVIRR